MSSATIASDVWFWTMIALIVGSAFVLARMVPHRGRKGLEQWLDQKSGVDEYDATFVRYLEEAIAGGHSRDWSHALLEALHSSVAARRRRAERRKGLQSTYLGLRATLLMSVLGLVSCVLSHPPIPVAGFAAQLLPFVCIPAALSAGLTLFLAQPIIGLYFDDPPLEGVQPKELPGHGSSGRSTQGPPSEPSSRRSHLR